MTAKYEAVCVKTCQFRRRLWHPGQVYSGYQAPPEGLFRNVQVAEMSEEAAEREREEREKAEKERIPSDPTPRKIEEPKAKTPKIKESR